MKSYYKKMNFRTIDYVYPDGYRPIEVGEIIPKNYWWSIANNGGSDISKWNYTQNDCDAGKIFDGVHYFSPRIVREESQKEENQKTNTNTNNNNTMNKPNAEVKTTNTRVLEAASKCPAAKETLKTLFPDVFIEDKSCDVTSQKTKTFDNGHFLSVRSGGDYEGKSFYLNSYYKWEIKTDCNGASILVPTKP